MTTALSGIDRLRAEWVIYRVDKAMRKRIGRKERKQIRGEIREHLTHTTQEVGMVEAISKLGDPVVVAAEYADGRPLRARPMRGFVAAALSVGALFGAGEIVSSIWDSGGGIGGSVTSLAFDGGPVNPYVDIYSGSLRFSFDAWLLVGLPLLVLVLFWAPWRGVQRRSFDAGTTSSSVLAKRYPWILGTLGIIGALAVGPVLLTTTDDSLRPATSGISVDPIVRPAQGDADGDGKLDVVVAQEGELVLVSNILSKHNRKETKLEIYKAGRFRQVLLADIDGKQGDELILLYGRRAPGAPADDSALARTATSKPQSSSIVEALKITQDGSVGDTVGKWTYARRAESGLSDARLVSMIAIPKEGRDQVVLAEGIVGQDGAMGANSATAVVDGGQPVEADLARLLLLNPAAGKAGGLREIKGARFAIPYPELKVGDLNGDKIDDILVDGRFQDSLWAQLPVILGPIKESAGPSLRRSVGLSGGSKSIVSDQQLPALVLGVAGGRQIITNRIDELGQALEPVTGAAGPSAVAGLAGEDLYGPGIVEADTDRVPGDGDMELITAVAGGSGESLALWSTARVDDVDGTELVERVFRLGTATVQEDGSIKASRSIGPEVKEGVYWAQAVEGEPSTLLLASAPFEEIIQGTTGKPKSILEVYRLTKDGGLKLVA